MEQQGQLGFAEGDSGEGYAKWIATRQMAAETAAEKLNLPIGHQAEIWLRGGIRLRGMLRLDAQLLFIEEDRVKTLPLVLDGVTFTYSEVESCVRLD
jgi:hypothetical protein